MDLSRFLRLNSFHYPTPLQEMPHLKEYLNCKPRLFVKRDDLTGLGLGGNKVRKLDFLLAEAKARGANTLITCGGLQSNHCRQTAAMASQFGFACHLVLEGEEPCFYQGNLLLDHLFGATLHFIGEDGDLDQEMERAAKKIEKEGGDPYIIPLGGSNPLGTLGYVESALEAIKEANRLGIAIDHAFLPTGSGGTQAGVALAARESSPKMQVHGISVSREEAKQRENVAELINGVYDLLGMEERAEARHLSVYDSFIGKGYGHITSEGLAAIRLLAKKEGLLLDPVYTGKAMAGMLQLLKEEPFSLSQGLLFFHTGGHPALFAYAEDLQ